LPKIQIVVPARVAGIDVFLDIAGKTWMAGTSIAKTRSRFSPAMPSLASVETQCTCKTWTYRER
jgi:hypothetical protein